MLCLPLTYDHGDRKINKSERVTHLIAEQSQSDRVRLEPLYKSVHEISHSLDGEVSWMIKYYNQYRQKAKERMKVMDQILDDLNT